MIPNYAYGTVTLNRGVGSGGDVTVDCVIGQAMTDITAPSRTGYTFNGYYTASSGGTKYYNANSSTSTTCTSAHVFDYAALDLYAQWTPATYAVTFNGNGKTDGTMANQTGLKNGTATTISDNAYEREYVVTYDGNGATLSTTSDTETWDFAGWTGAAQSGKQGYIVEDLDEYTGTHSGSNYLDIKQWTINQPFKPGEQYVLEFDAKGSGKLYNYFYNTAALACVKAESSNGTVTTGGDGSITHNLTSSYKHYKITWTLGDSGSETANKYLLFRALNSTVTFKNVKFYQTKFFDGSRLLNLASGGTYTMTAQWDEGDVTLNTPELEEGNARYYWDFHNWSVDQDATDGEYEAGETYCLYDEFAGDKTLYAIWSRDLDYTYHWFNADESDDLTASDSTTVYNRADTLTLTSPAAGDVVTTVTNNDKTWALVGWNEQDSVTWGGATVTAADTDSNGFGQTHDVTTTGENDDHHTFMPVYALQSTTFYADYKYYATNATAYSTVTKSADVIGDATTGAMDRAPLGDIGNTTTAQQSYSKNGYYYKLKGWTLTEPDASFGPANPLKQSDLPAGATFFPVTEAAYTLNVPGATDTDKHNTKNVDEHVMLYPVYENDGTALNARLYIYGDGGVVKPYDISVKAAGATTTLQIPTAEDMVIRDPETDEVTDYNTYTKDGVTYTLVGWNYTPDAGTRDPADENQAPLVSVNDSNEYLPLSTETAPQTVTLAEHDNPSSDYYEFYPVYEFTTTVEYHSYDADGNQVSETESTPLLKNDTTTPPTANVAIPAVNESFTLDGRTFTFAGWRKDTTSDEPVAALVHVIEGGEYANEPIRDEAYHYYAVYANDKLTLSYNASHDDLNGEPVPADQVLDTDLNEIQYLNAGRTAATANASAHTFTVNPSNTIPLKTGYTFIGWDLNEDNIETEAYQYADGAALALKANQTLYAKFSVNDLTVTFKYYDKTASGGIESGIKSVEKTVSYDDGTRDDTNEFREEDGLNRYAAAAPTVQKVGASNTVNATTIAHANDTYHFVFSHWQRSDGKNDPTPYYWEQLDGINYDAKFKGMTENVTIQAVYNSYRHHYVDLTNAEAAAQGDATAPNAYLEATCTTDGYHWHRCTVCGHIYKEIIEKFDHKNSEGTEIVAYSGYKAPTCTATGLYAIARCALCGQQVMDGGEPQYYDYVDGAFVRIPAADANGGVKPATGHNPQKTETKAATCTEGKYDVFVCANGCGYTYKVYDPASPALEHPEESRVTEPAVEPTCTEDGRTAKVVCSLCGFVLQDSHILPKKGHTLEKTPAKAVTCLLDGNIEYYTCTECGALFKDKFAIQPTTAAEVKITAPGSHLIVDTEAASATCTMPGHSAGQMCERCGYVPEGGAVIDQPALGHEIDYDHGVHTDIATDKPCEEPAGYTTYYCVRYGTGGCTETVVEYDELAEHVPENVPAKAPTCTEEGYTAHQKCSVCGKILSEDYEIIPKTAHDLYTPEGFEGTEPTCTEPGLSARQDCRNCHQTIVAQTSVPAKGHNYSSWIVTTAATCTVAGEEMRFCKRCGVDETQAIPAAHKYQNVPAVAPTCYAEGTRAGKKCSVCGDVLEGCETISNEDVGHVLGTPTVIAATCTTPEKTVTKCIYYELCGHIETVETPDSALGHDMVVTKAGRENSCTTDGFTAEKTCSRCGLKESSTYLPRLEHVWETVPGTPATCGEDGVSSYEKCALCGIHYSEPQVIKATGHRWTVWATVTPATCTTPGLKKQTCKNVGCDAERTQVIPIAGHQMAHYEAVAATCTEPGNPEYYVCYRCGTDIYYKNEAGTAQYTAEEIVKPALDHDWYTVETVPPTCAHKGYDLQYCHRTGCDATQKINFTGPADHVVGTPATCVSKAICGVCGQYFGAYNGNNHDMVVIEHVDGDCQHYGYENLKCAREGCTHTEHKTLPKGEHVTEIVWVTEPTCTTDGVYNKICTVCGDTLAENVVEPAPGHYDEDGDGLCDFCGEEMPSDTPETPETPSGSTGTCDKCGRNHVGQVGGFFGYNGFMCKLIAFFRSIARLFSR